MNILIVDDNDDVRLILRKILAAAGHQVEEAENGNQALASARRVKPDLIVSDILMPEMDGFQLCREVRADETLKDTPLVFYTATYTDEQDERFALELGVDRFIRKPVDSGTFLAAIEDLARQADRGQIVPSKQELDNDTAFLKLYNERLIQKLEKKMADLETEIVVRREAEAQLAATLEAIPDMIFRIDRDGRFLSFKAANGFQPYVPAEEFLGRTFAEVLPADVACNALASLKRVLDGGGTEVFQYQLFLQDAWRHYEARFAPLNGSEVVALVRDVTAECLAQMQLRASESRFRALVESSDDHIFMLDPDGHYLATNERCVACQAGNGQTIVGKHYKDFHNEALTEEYRAQLNEVVATGQSISFEHRAGSDDDPLWHLDTLYPIEQDGKVTAVGVICRDITVHKNAELALRRSEVKYRELFEHSPDAIAVITLDGRITDANGAFAEMFGYTLEEIFAKNAKELFVDPDAREKMVSQILAEGSVRSVESRRRRKDGTEIICTTSAQVRLDSAGKPIDFLNITRDITAMRSLEKQFLQAQKMESVGHLAGGVAHDFNNMLSIILGYAEMTREKLSMHDPLYENITEIVTAARRSADLVRQLLAFARKQVVSPKILNLNKLIDGSRKMLSRLIGEDIELKFVPDEGLWSVKMDPSQIDQILANLAVNARDAIGGIGKLIIQTDNVVVDDKFCLMHHAFNPGQFVVLTVSDTGAGMTKEVSEKIFEPFFTTKGIGTGTGLGLSTVYGIVKQNNGFITVYSEPGHGTTFKIYLPRHKGELEPLVSSAQNEPLSGSETVLVVEDEEKILQLCEVILKSKGYRVLSATSSGDAVLICEKHQGPIDLLLTDVVMPNMNGNELQERVATLRPEIKLIYMSGYTADIVMHRGVLAQGANFLQKPFSTTSLLRKVRDVLDG